MFDGNLRKYFSVARLKREHCNADEPRQLLWTFFFNENYSPLAGVQDPKPLLYGCTYISPELVVFRLRRHACYADVAYIAGEAPKVLEPPVF